MKPREDINDYASFLKAKYALKEEMELERGLMNQELKQGLHHLNPLNLFSGVVDQLLDSGMMRKVTNAFSIFAFVKDLFRKKQKHEFTEE